MRFFSFNSSGSSSLMAFGRRETSVGWPVMRAWALMSNTKSFGVRSTQLSAVRLLGST